MSAREYHENRTPKWVLAVQSSPHIREVYETNMAGAARNFLAGAITETELESLQWILKQRAVRRYHQNHQGMRRAA